MKKQNPFLTAVWRDLVMMNYAVDPELLRSYLPSGTELDYWQGKALVSMVGFMFLKTKVLGIPIPFHSNFEEVNLRFYVRRKTPEGWRRGTVFIKEIVPRWAIATVARVCYNENYEAMPMRHEISENKYQFDWRYEKKWNSLQALTAGDFQNLVPGSEAEFITEHYWGYSKQPNGSTIEYQVEHPAWRVRRVREAHFDCDVKSLYGAGFVESLQAEPFSALVAEGSAVTVYQGVKL
jgi:uncharacterized protein